jgi:hypothetical protein
VQRLQTAREGGAAFRRRQALRAALQDYEQRQQPGNITPAAPIDPVPA